MIHKLIFTFLLLAFLAVLPTMTLGQQVTPANPQSITNPDGSKTPTIENPLGDVGDPRALLGRIIGAAMGVVGSLALVVFLYGGFTWMTSGGNADRVKHGRDLIVWAAIGLFVIFASYAMVRFVLETVATKSGAVQ